MALRWYTIVVDSHDPQGLARWWQRVLDWQIVHDEEDEAVIIPKDLPVAPTHALEDWLQLGQGLVFVMVPEEKTVKNRLHIDLAPHTSQDRNAEIEQLIDMGATHVDIGQSDDVTWTVLADPEGNEFCVLSSRDQ